MEADCGTVASSSSLSLFSLSTMRTFAFGRGSNGRATAEDAEEDEAVDSELVEIGVMEMVAIVGVTDRQAGAAKEALTKH